MILNKSEIKLLRSLVVKELDIYGKTSKQSINILLKSLKRKLKLSNICKVKSSCSCYEKTKNDSNGIIYLCDKCVIQS